MEGTGGIFVHLQQSSRRLSRNNPPHNSPSREIFVVSRKQSEGKQIRSPSTPPSLLYKLAESNLPQINRKQFLLKIEHFQHPGGEKYLQKWSFLLRMPTAQVLPQNPHPKEDQSQLFRVGYPSRIITISFRLILEPQEKSLILEQIAEEKDKSLKDLSLKDK